MEKGLNQLLVKAQKNKKLLISLKILAVEAKEYDLGAQLRDLEKKLFPETEEIKKAKEQATQVQLSLRMAGLHIEVSECWLIAETIKAHLKMKGKFDLKTVSVIQSKQEKLFNK